MGKLVIQETTYRMFTNRVRKLMPDATDKEIYREWCRDVPVSAPDMYSYAVRKIVSNRRRATNRKALP